MIKLNYSINYLNKNINLFILNFNNKKISFNLIYGINYYLYYNKENDSIRISSKL